MYLEVTCGDERPVTYRLTRPQIAVGTLLANDLVLNSPSISKKHLKIIFQVDRWFIIDEGSTNGSYLGESQLEPGKLTEFQPEDELRLGDQVYIRLLVNPLTARVLEFDPAPQNEEVFSELKTHEKTRMISIEEFRAAEAMAVERKRKLRQEKERAEKAFIVVDIKSTLKVISAALILIVIAMTLEWTWQSSGNVSRDEFIKLPKDDSRWRLPGSQ